MKWYDYVVLLFVGGLIGGFIMNFVVDSMGHSTKSFLLGVSGAAVASGLFGFGYVKFTFWRDDK